MKLHYRLFGKNLRLLVFVSTFCAGFILGELQASKAASLEQIQPPLVSLGPVDPLTATTNQPPPKNKENKGTQSQATQEDDKEKKSVNQASDSTLNQPPQSTPHPRKNSPRLPDGFWLSISALLIGITGACLGIWNWMQISITNHENIKELRDLQKRFKALDLGIKGKIATSIFESRVNELGTQILALENLVRRQSQDFADLKSQLFSPHSDSSSIKDYHPSRQVVTNVDYPQFNLPSSHFTELQQFASPPQPSPSDLQSALTALINRGDRQTFKKEVRSELNITDDSASLIATGRITQTELEEVAGGGSYWLVEIAGQTWLYPTDLTLSGFSQFQPSKGIFSYEKQQISVPQVLTPALVEPLGSNWRIAKMGSIAVPG